MNYFERSVVMSGYYARVSNISGAKSSVATSAYMSREKLKDDTMNRTFNYSGHEHDNTFSNITLCENAPKEWQDKAKLWNAVEEQEQGKNTRKARQWILAIPQEMTQEQQEEAVKKFQEYLAGKGMCSQADIHEAESKRSAATIEKNKHAHVLATQRLINAQGEWEQIKEKKVYANCRDSQGKPSYNPDIPNDTEHRIPKIDPATGKQKIGARNRKEWERVTIQDNPLNKKELIEESRQKWAEICNQYLSAEQKIDNRSYERQGIDKISELHEGVGTHQDYDDRVEYNRTVKMANENMAAIKSVHPHEATEIKENLHGIRQSLEHDRDSRRSERDNPGTARSDTASPGRENDTERRTPESTAAASTRAEEKREEHTEQFRNTTVKERESGTTRSVADSRERSKAFHESFGEFVGRTAEENQHSERVGEKQSEVGRGQSQNSGTQQRIADAATETFGNSEGIREKLFGIRDRIKQAFESIRAKFKPRTGEPDNGLEKPTSEPIREERREPTMGAMSRFNEIAANQEKARQEENKQMVSENEQKQKKESVLDRLHRYEQGVKEGRAEPLQSEQTNKHYKNIYETAQKAVKEQSEWMKKNGVSQEGIEPGKFGGDYKADFERTMRIFQEQSERIQRAGFSARSYNELSSSDEYLRTNKTLYPRNRANVEPLRPDTERQQRSQNYHI